MLRRDVSRFLLAGSVGASAAVPGLEQATTCNPPCYPRLPAESNMTLIDTAYDAGDVRRYGAKGDGRSASAAGNTTAFANARTVAATTGTRVTFPAGVYYYSASPNWGISGITLQAIGHVQLMFLGSGNAWEFKASIETHPDGKKTYIDAYNCRMLGDFTIIGNQRATNGLYVFGVHHSEFQARVANVSQSGCDINFSVGSSFRVQTTIYANGGARYTTTPLRGYYLKGREPGEYTAWCQFHATIIDRCAGFGIDILHARGCAFFGGFIEYCFGGIRVGSAGFFCEHNSFYNIDMESNSDYDVVIDGQHNRLIGCTTASYAAENDNLIIGEHACATQVIGGYIRVCTVRSGSRQTLFVNASFCENHQPSPASVITGRGEYRTTGCFLIDPRDSHSAWTRNLPDMMPNLPVSPFGLPPGSLWNSDGTLKIV
jgi:hypothetical protein